MQDLGLNASRMVAGFAGGLCISFALRDRDPRSITASVVVGAFTANYLTDAVAHYISGWVGLGGISFITGLAAMAICQGVVAAIRTKIKIVTLRGSEPMETEEKNP